MIFSRCLRRLGAVAFGLSLTVGATSTLAAVSFDADFGDTTDGLTTLPDVGSRALTNATAAAIADTGNVFGEGVDNGVLSLKETGVNPVQYRGFFNPDNNNDGTYSFDFFEAGATDGYLRVQFFGNGSNNHILQFENGALSQLSGGGAGSPIAEVAGVYAVGAAHHIDILFNARNGLETNGTSFSVAADTYQVYVDGSLKFTGVLSGRTDVDQVRLITNAETTGFLIDNVVALDEQFVVIPEPMSLSLVGLAGLLLSPRRRR